MVLFFVTCPRGVEHFKNLQGVHVALVDVVNGLVAITAANVLMLYLNIFFDGFDIMQVVAMAAGGFALCVFEGDALGTSYTGPGRGK